jgi:hypothetical protein
MARGRINQDPTILQMALVGYQIELEKIDAKVRELQSLLKGRRTGFSSDNGKREPAPVKRVLSAAARNRIAAAQRKRWAKHRRLKGQGGKA